MYLHLEDPVLKDKTATNIAVYIITGFTYDSRKWQQDRTKMVQNTPLHHVGSGIYSNRKGSEVGKAEVSTETA
jgi:hypothetical protein